MYMKRTMFGYIPFSDKPSFIHFWRSGEPPRKGELKWMCLFPWLHTIILSRNCRGFDGKFW